MHNLNNRFASSGSVAHIHLAGCSGANLTGVESVEAVAGRGLRGDRHFAAEPSEPFPDWRQLTLAAEEDLLDFCREYAVEYFPGCSRRQLTTRGVDVKSLIGKTFQIGAAVCVGIEECHPCRQLTELWTPAALRGLIGRGGLRAGILTSGIIETGAEIIVVRETAATVGV